jgi:hypothetical protein
MCQGDLLDLITHGHLFGQRLRFLQRPVEARPTDWRELTHTLDTQAALL